MQKIAWLLATVLAVWAPARAQRDFPRADLFAGFSYLRQGGVFSGRGTNYFGWQTNFSVNLTKVFGLEGDVGGQYHRLGYAASKYEYQLGPRVSYRAKGVTLFAHALGGGGSFSLPYSTSSGGAVSFGGGVDININKRIGVRLAQIDLVHERPSVGGNGHQLRGAIGLVIRFGD